MSEKDQFSEKVFARYQELLNGLPPEKHSMIVKDLIDQLYQYIHDYTQRMDKPNPLQTTALANSFIRSLLEDENKLVEPFQGAIAFPQYLKYLQRGIAWFVSNKIVKENKDFPFVQAPIDPNNEQGLDFPDDYQPETITRDIVERLIQILNDVLNEDQKQLLEMKLGSRFVVEGNSVGLVPYQKPMTFPQIAEALGGGQTEKSVQKRFSRLIEKIKKTPAVILLYRDFTE